MTDPMVFMKSYQDGLEKVYKFDGKRIQEKRKQQHLTQKQTAKLLGLTQSIISDYETGKTIPSLKTLPRLAILFNTSVDYLLGLTDEPKPMIHSNTATKTERDLLQAFYALSLEKRERAVGILIGLREG